MKQSSLLWTGSLMAAFGIVVVALVLNRSSLSEPRVDPKELWKTLPDATETDDKIRLSVKKLFESNEYEQIKAARSLAKMGPAAKSAVPALILALESQHPLEIYYGGSLTPWDGVPPAARDALAAIGREAVPACQVAMKSRDPLTRVLAASALWKIEKQANLVTPLLFTALYDAQSHQGDDRIRIEAIHALAQIGIEQPEAVLPRLLEDFLNPRDNVFELAAEVMQGMGSAAKGAIPVLIATVRKNRDRIPISNNSVTDRTRWAGLVLRQIGDDAVPAIVSLVEDDDPTIRHWGVWMLMSK